ncbi:peptidase [Salipaludibacillus neizhouensis]|uniref:Peptidase n=1 Tax=Salipaludibacillus neizhouensis TaxID=885475 RepID=A0A3A9KTU5_9BACI|nr:peptidoglycan-binding protein [Salipaludibacillus neizhouensis]RKL68036.1 peptidase [Salipaludibacillus neizhouensis]
MKKVVMSVILAGSLLVLPTVSGAALGDQTLREGIRHGDVEELQDALRDTGHFNSSNSTGYFGPVTNKSVRAFQKSKGLSVDGIAGPNTFSALGVSGGSSSSSSKVSASSSSINFSQTLRQGSRGSAVRTLQNALNNNGANAGTADGVFGPNTASAVRSFQRSAGIGVDGIAGPQTYKALNGGSGSSASSSSGGSTASSGSTGSVSNSASSASSSTVESIISTARGQIGASYVWGGTTPSGFDCSGFLNYAFHQNGQSMPRTVASIYSAATKVSSPQRGDIVFFETRTGPSHAGIYLGNNQFIHSGSSTGVTISNMSNPYWSKAYMGAGRL